MTDKKKSEIRMAIGHASMCWNPIPSGIFDEQEANKVADNLIKVLDESPSDSEAVELWFNKVEKLLESVKNKIMENKTATKIIERFSELAKQKFITAKFGDNWVEHQKRMINEGQIDTDVVLNLAWHQGRRALMLEKVITELVDSIEDALLIAQDNESSIEVIGQMEKRMEETLKTLNP